MFTGIVHGTASLSEISDYQGLRTFTIEFSLGFCRDLVVGASVCVDGVCLTVTEIVSTDVARFDVIPQSLSVTALGGYGVGATVNVERAATDGAEIGGHPISGHIDFSAPIIAVQASENNRLLRIAIPPQFRKYVFAKGYIAINGASLSVSEVNRHEGWFEVWLIPETRRVTVFEQKQAGDILNLEIERGTQVVVDTVREAVELSLGKLKPALDAVLQERGLNLEDFIYPPALK
ncbi:riboflavin synthase subunit alpha [Caballeronia sp. 15711]|uniref:riboflavin synthase subunit alpha n=1 Tax=Caballeronia sp. 15711 TaxID=3391029 RepID=UPI0039E46FBE